MADLDLDAMRYAGATRLTGHPALVGFDIAQLDIFAREVLLAADVPALIAEVERLRGIEADWVRVLDTDILRSDPITDTLPGLRGRAEAAEQRVKELEERLTEEAERAIESHIAYDIETQERLIAEQRADAYRELARRFKQRLLVCHRVMRDSQGKGRDGWNDAFLDDLLAEVATFDALEKEQG